MGVQWEPVTMYFSAAGSVEDPCMIGDCHHSSRQSLFFFERAPYLSDTLACEHDAFACTDPVREKRDCATLATRAWRDPCWVDIYEFLSVVVFCLWKMLIWPTWASWEPGIDLDESSRNERQSSPIQIVAYPV